MDLVTFETIYNGPALPIKVSQSCSIRVVGERLGTRVFSLTPGKWLIIEGYDKKHKRNRLVIRRNE